MDSVAEQDVFPENGLLEWISLLYGGNTTICDLEIQDSLYSAWPLVLLASRRGCVADEYSMRSEVVDRPSHQEARTRLYDNPDLIGG